MNQWQYYHQLKDYLASVKEYYHKTHSEVSEGFGRWLEWAEAYLETKEPFRKRFPVYDLTMNIAHPDFP